MAEPARDMEFEENGGDLVTLSRSQLRRLHRLSIENVPVKHATAEFERLVSELGASSRVVNTTPRPTENDCADAAAVMRRRRRKVRGRR